MGYKSTKYPCDNQACIKEKHFQPLLSPALAKWAWLPLSLVPWPPPVPCIPAGAPRAPTQAHQLPPPLGTVPVGGWCSWCSFCEPNLNLPWHRTGKVLRKPRAFLMLSFCPVILWPQKRKRVPKTGREKNGSKGRMDFPWSVSNLFYKKAYTLTLSRGEMESQQTHF